MKLIAYMLFILHASLPYLVLMAIAAGLIGGLTMIVIGAGSGRALSLLAGTLLMIASGAAAIAIRHWAVTPPPKEAAARSAHVVVHTTYRQMRARQQALTWMHDGTVEKWSNAAQEERKKRPESPDRP